MSRLLFFASDYLIGLSSLLTDQLIALHNSGVEITAIAGETEQEKGLSILIDSKGISIIRIKGLDAHCHFRALAKTIAQIIINKNIHYVHVQNNWQLALAVYAKYVLLRKRNLKFIYTIHGFRHNHPIKAVIAKMVIGTALFIFADHIICMSSYLKKQFFLLSYKIKLLPLGIADSFFINKHSIGVDNGLQMIFPAQFRYGKNQDVIIRSFARHIVETGDQQSHLTLPGNGELLDQMKELVDKLGISNRVSFPGQCNKEEIRQMYLNCNIGIVASNSETFGQSIVEPYVLGRCIITTPVGIACDIIRSGENGYVFETEKELKAIFRKLLENPELIILYGEYNFIHRDMFRWNSICSDYKTMLK